MESQQRIVVVTGGASGIGAEVARVSARNGMHVIVADRQEDAGQAVAQEIGGTFYPLDVADVESWRGVMTAARDLPGTVFGLVQAAGVYPRYDLDHPDHEQFHAAVAVNQLGLMLGIELFGPHLVANGAGSIVNVASAAGISTTQTRNIAYASTKWAARGIGRVAAREYAAAGVRVNTVLPGLIDTPMIRAIHQNDPVRVAQMTGSVPMGRMGLPADIANAVWFFLSDSSPWVTGAELVVDGGTTA